MQLTVQEVETKLKEDGWYQVNEPGVEPGVRRYRHQTKSGPVDMKGEPDHCMGAGATNSVFRQAGIIRV